MKACTRWLSLPITVLMLASCSLTDRVRNSYPVWHGRNQAEVASLTQYLAAQGVADVLPASQLLRSASAWEECHAEPYAVPPQAQWASVASVLTLLQHLKTTGVLAQIEVFSGYRNPALNTCAGGAEGSAHRNSFALDFKALEPANAAETLCHFWRTEGKAWNMGFSIYPSGRIHIDTAGYRSWGHDHTRHSAVCSAQENVVLEQDRPGAIPP